MAKKTETVVTLTDDLDGTKAERTITFSYDGTAYELELSKKNIAAFEKAMAPYIEHGRRATARAGESHARRAAGVRGRSAGSDVSAIRQWAREQGMEISSRGRVPQSVQKAYAAAH